MRLAIVALAVCVFSTSLTAEGVDVREFGAVGDGVADDSEAVLRAIASCKSSGLPLYLAPRSVFWVDPAHGMLDLPSTGVYGGGRLSGATCRFRRVKNIVVEDLRCEDLLLSGVWYLDLQHLECKALTIDGGGSEEWGSFWNSFQYVVCASLTIDVDNLQSVNQNRFGFVKAPGGVRIVGKSTTNRFREAHNNVFSSIDTTQSGAKGSGPEISNESVLNQTNTIVQWYSDYSGDGSGRIRGNWNLLFSNVDSNGGQLSIGDRNSALFSTTGAGRSDGDFLAAGRNNLARGGEWDVLNAVDLAPISLRNGTGRTFQVLADADNAPSGVPYSAHYQSKKAPDYLQIDTPTRSPRTVVLSLWYEGPDFLYASNDSGVFSSCSGTYTHRTGWKLLRVIMPATKEYIRLYLNNGGENIGKTLRVNSYFATDQKTGLLPTWSAKPPLLIGKGKSEKSSFSIPVTPIPGVITQAGTLRLDLLSVDGLRYTSSEVHILVRTDEGLGKVLLDRVFVQNSRIGSPELTSNDSQVVVHLPESADSWNYYYSIRLEDPITIR